MDKPIPTLKEIVAKIAPTMQCNCDLDKWQPEPSTGHSFICRINKSAVEIHRYGKYKSNG